MIFTVLPNFAHLVVVIEQPQRCCTVFITIDAHHGLSGSSQWVLQVVPPRFIVAVKHSTRWHHHFIWYYHHQSFTERTMGLTGTDSNV